MDEADFCFSSLIFTSAVAAVSTLLIISSLSISLLCARVRRNDKGGRESARDVMHTLRLRQNFCFLSNSSFPCRSSRSVRSEYVHSPQARIP